MALLLAAGVPLKGLATDFRRIEFGLNLRVYPRPYCWPLRHPSACRRNRGPPNDRHDPPAKLPALSRVLPQDGQRGPVRRLRYGALFEAARPPQSESDQDAARSAMRSEEHTSE